MARFILALTLFACASCATTGAYVQTHPEVATVAQVAAAALNCVDHAAAGLILEEDAPTILQSAFACAADIFAGGALNATKDEISRELVSRQTKALRAVRARQSIEKSGPLSLSAAPAASFAQASDPVIAVPELYSWEQIIGNGHSAD